MTDTLLFSPLAIRVSEGRLLVGIDPASATKHRERVPTVEVYSALRQWERVAAVGRCCFRE